MKRIAIMGTGGVGLDYASEFIALGYEVMPGTRKVSAFVVTDFRRMILSWLLKLINYKCLPGIYGKPDL